MALVDEGVTDEGDGLVDPIEGRQRAHELPHHLRQPPVVGGTVRQSLHVAHGVEGEIAHRPRVERGEALHVGHRVPGEQILQHREGIVAGRFGRVTLEGGDPRP